MSAGNRGKIAKFGALGRADKRMFVRAVWWLLVARLMLMLIPFRRLSRRLASSRPMNSRKPDPDFVRRVGVAVARAANNVPWRSDCFPQTVAARTLLRRRGYRSTIHFGVEREGEDELNAHAWLTCGNMTVTGGSGLERFTELHRIEC